MFSREPVRIVSIVISIALAALPHLPTFGVPITPDQIDALMTFLPSVIVLLGGQVARAYVTPATPATVSPVQKG